MGNLKCMLSYQEKCEIIKYTHPEELLNKLIFKNSTTDLKLGIFIHIIVIIHNTSFGIALSIHGFSMKMPKT